MVHRIARRMLGRLWWAFRHQVNHVKWSFFVWERQSQLPQFMQGRIILADSGDEAIGERMAVLRGTSVNQYRAWLRDGHRALYAIGPNNDIQSWIWFTVAKGGPQVVPFDFGTGMKVPPGIAFLWDAFTVPAYRRQGLYKTLLVQAIKECFTHGARQVWGHANVANASRKIILTTDPAGETTIKATRIGPFCRISRPGFHRTISVPGVLEMDTLLPSIRTNAVLNGRGRDAATDVR
jgi:GNAT superfamily N-acetyltransferase